MRSNPTIIRNAIVNKIIYCAIVVGLPLNLCSSDSVKEDENKKFIHKLGSYVTLKHEANFEASASSKNYISDKLNALPFNAKVGYIMNLDLDFNKDGNKSLYKIVNIDADISAINGVLFVGDVLKYKDKFGYYFLDKYMVLNSAKIKWDFAEINKKHRFGTVLRYGKSDYSANKDARLLGIDLKYTLNFDKSDNLNEFGVSIGAEFGTDSGLMVYKILSSINDEKPENYKWLGPSIFTNNNYAEVGLSAAMPRICSSMLFKFKKDVGVDANIMFFISPLGNAIVGSSYIGFMPWGVIINTKIKHGLSNEVNSTLRIGNDELSSYYFIDSYIDGFKKKSDMIYSYNKGFYYGLPRVLIMNENVEYILHFEQYTSNVGFIKEVTVNISQKTESLFRVAYSGKDIFLKNILPLDFYFYENLFAEIAIKPSIKFNDKVSNHNRKLWFLNNFEASASLTFYIKPTIECSRVGNDPIGIRVKSSSFGFKITLLNSEFNFGNGHHLKFNLVNLEYYEKLKWTDLAGITYTFNLTEFLRGK